MNEQDVREFRNTAVVAVIVMVLLTIGSIMYTTYRVNRVVSRALDSIETMVEQYGEENIKQGAEWVKETYSDSLENLTQEQYENLKGRLDAIWKLKNE